MADFRIALAVQQAGGGRLTETGLSLGTPYYMSPEQAMAGARDVGLPYDAPIAGGMPPPAFAVARDGSFIVYEGGVGGATQLWYRSLVDDEARSIAGTEGASWTPRISPDGRRVAFVSESALRVVPIEGGVVTTVAEVEGPIGGTWQDDGMIFLSDGDGQLLRWVDPESGPARDLAVEYCLLPVTISETDVL